MAGSNEYMREYMKNRYAKRRAEAIEKLGGACAICLSREGLEVDHKDPDQKRLSFKQMYAVGQERFDEELNKCQLLCRNCHQNKSTSERGFNERSQHGTLVSYQRGKCRCELCRAANAAHSRKYKARKRAMGR